MKIFFLYFLIFVGLSQSQLIVSSYSYDYDLSNTLQIFQNTFDKHLAEKINNITFGTFTEKGYEFSDFKLNTPSINLVSSYVNFKTGTVILAPNKFVLSYSFKVKKGEEDMNGEFEIKIFDFVIKFKYNKKKFEHKVKVNIRDRDMAVYEVNNNKTEVLEILRNKFKEKNIQEAIESFNEDLQECMSKEYFMKIPNYNLILSNLLNNKEVDITFQLFTGICEQGGNAESSICFYQGSVDPKTDVFDYRYDYKDIQTFDIWNQNYKVFLNYYLLNQVFNQTVSTVMVSNPKSEMVHKLNLNYTINTLQNIFNNISGDPTKSFSVDSKINSISYCNDIGKLTLEHKVKDAQTTLVSFETVISFNVNASQTNYTKFNVCLNELKLENTTILSQTTFKNKNMFDEIFAKILNYGNEKTCLTDKGISVKDYFRYLNTSEKTKKGIVLTGQKLYGY